MKEKKVLIVEDDKNAIFLLKEILKDLDCSLDVVENGQDAINRISQSKPDLVMLDIGLPQVDGLDVARWMRANPVTNEIPIFAVTIYVSEENRREILEAGCNEHIKKPFDIKELRRLLMQYLSSA